MGLDTVIVGHVTIDVNVHPWGIIENVLGGAPTYAGFTLAALKRDVGVVSKIGQDFPEKFPPIFSKFGLDTEGILVTSGETTTFENTYDENGNRKQVCTAVADSISPKDIPRPYRDARSFYISPVAGEISPNIFDPIEKDDTRIMLDPQGIFRVVGESGKITVRPPDNLDEYLTNVDIVKIGKEEYESFGEKDEESVLKNLVDMGPEVAILTLGEKGCLVLANGNMERIKGLNVEVKDLTGAGDVFGAAFLSSYLDTYNAVRSSRFAAVAAGLKLEYKGPVGFPSEEDVLKEL